MLFYFIYIFILFYYFKKYIYAICVCPWQNTVNVYWCSNAVTCLKNMPRCFSMHKWNAKLSSAFPSFMVVVRLNIFLACFCYTQGLPSENKSVCEQNCTYADIRLDYSCKEQFGICHAHCSRFIMAHGKWKWC